jgi:hypothetical protein
VSIVGAHLDVGQPREELLLLRVHVALPDDTVLAPPTACEAGGEAEPWERACGLWPGGSGAHRSLSRAAWLSPCLASMQVSFVISSRGATKNNPHLTFLPRCASDSTKHRPHRCLSTRRRSSVRAPNGRARPGGLNRCRKACHCRTRRGLGAPKICWPSSRISRQPAHPKEEAPRQSHRRRTLACPWSARIRSWPRTARTSWPR